LERFADFLTDIVTSKGCGFVHILKLGYLLVDMEQKSCYEKQKADHQKDQAKAGTHH